MQNMLLKIWFFTAALFLTTTAQAGTGIFKCTGFNAKINYQSIREISGQEPFFVFSEIHFDRVRYSTESGLIVGKGDIASQKFNIQVQIYTGNDGSEVKYLGRLKGVKSAFGWQVAFAPFVAETNSYSMYKVTCYEVASDKHSPKGT